MSSNPTLQLRHVIRIKKEKTMKNVCVYAFVCYSCCVCTHLCVVVCVCVGGCAITDNMTIVYV